MNRRAFPIILIALSSLPSASFGAPPSVSSTDAIRAQGHVVASQKLLAAKAYKEALEELLEAYRLDPEARTARSLVGCLRSLQRFAEAHDAITQLVAAHATQLTAADRAALDRERGELEAMTGTVTITVNEPDASIKIDSKPVASSRLSAPIRLDVGPHTVRIEHEGFIPVTSSIAVVSEKEFALEATLLRETGRLVVREAQNRSVDVLLDDVLVGTTPWEGTVAPGKHRVTGKTITLRTGAVSAEFEAGKTLEVTLEGRAVMGRLKIRTNVGGASIDIDDAPAGGSPYSNAIDVGVHRVRGRAPGFLANEIEVEIREETATDVLLTLDAAPSDVPQPQPKAASEYRGFFFRMDALGLIQAASEPVFDCNSPGTVACDTTAAPLGGGLAFHFGDMFQTRIGMLGFDITLAMTALAGAKREQALLSQDPNQPPSRGSLSVTAPGAFLGAGPRFLSRGEQFRYTAAVVGGPSTRLLYSGSGGPAAVVVSPALVADVGILLGATPGAKFTAGLMTMVEFAGASTGSASGTAQGLPVNLAGRTDVSLGPYLGFQTGH